MHTETTEVTVLIVVGILIIGAVSTVARRIGVAAPLLLVAIGAGIALVPGAPQIEVEAEVILTVVLPPLLFAAALKVPAVDFRRNLEVIVFLSVVLVAASAFAVAAAVQSLWPVVGFATALALGAVVAPPDAVAATALGRRLGLPPRVLTILEGEGLVNDATALVLLSTASAAAATGAAFEVGATIGDFAWAVLSALAVGAATGLLNVLVRSRVHDQALDTAISVTTPFLAFLAAEVLGGSGVVAVVIAGLLVGNRGVTRIPAEARLNERTTWESFLLIVENGVFFTMGLQLPIVVGSVIADGPGSLWPVIGLSALVWGVLVAVRFALLPPLLLWLRARARSREREHLVREQRLRTVNQVVAGRPDIAGKPQVRRRLDRAQQRIVRGRNDITALRDQRLGWGDTAVIGWAGMRGVVTVAAVQTLPADGELRDRLVLVAFLVAVATLLVQGATLPALVRLLRLRRDTRAEELQELSELIGELTSAAEAAIHAAAASGGYDTRIVDDAVRRTRSRRVWFEQLAREEQPGEEPEPAPKADAASASASQAETGPDVQAPGSLTQLVTLRRRALAAQRTLLAEARGDGSHSSIVLARAQELIDRDEIALEFDRGAE